VTYFTTRNIYSYDSKNLIISYSVAVFFTLLALSLGSYSFRYNGVAHSTRFSALAATTRNLELDAFSKGHSFGALPLDDRMKDVKVRFGVLCEREEK
jgi:hypothetical protein